MRHPDVYCERCGAIVDVDWIEITAFADPEPSYVQGQRRCPTSGCGTTCPICRRPVGDIHSGACAPIVLGKVTEQVWVTRADCLAVLS